MSGHREELGATTKELRNLGYDRDTIKVVVLACVMIIIAVVLTGGIGYFITRNAVVTKLKTYDLANVVDSIAGKLDGRIARAKETALILAKDPVIIDWMMGAEADQRLGEYAKAKINGVAQDYDYANSFIISAVTNHYWAEGSRMVQVMSKSDPSSRWFYDALQSGKAIDVNIDYNVSRKDTFVFLNALVGEVRRPVGVVGVGLSLQDVAQEFRSYTASQRSGMWLVDRFGKIHLSDNLTTNGKSLYDVIPTQVANRLVRDMNHASDKPTVIEYKAANGAVMDMAYQTTRSTDWKLVYQIPRSESIAILDTIKLNATIASILSLLLAVLVFFTVSRRIANPLRRAVQLAQEMERKVRERTVELVEKNQKIMDSIDYAKRLQESVLPSAKELAAVFKDYFVIWKPRDTVGGDFYTVRRMDPERSLVIIADCTGHGVPGALMTMAVQSILNEIIDQEPESPAKLLALLNRRVKAVLHRYDQNGITDDGLDIAICLIEQGKRLTFAGAKLHLYRNRANQVEVIKGDNHSIGYRRSNPDWQFTDHELVIEPGDRFYLSTDGYVDQNGGAQDLPFGRSRFTEAIGAGTKVSLVLQAEVFKTSLQKYMGNEPQRDDITIIGFSF